VAEKSGKVGKVEKCRFAPSLPTYPAHVTCGSDGETYLMSKARLESDGKRPGAVTEGHRARTASAAGVGGGHGQRRERVHCGNDRPVFRVHSVTQKLSAYNIIRVLHVLKSKPFNII
jgi:hypothetical protein